LQAIFPKKLVYQTFNWLTNLSISLQTNLSTSDKWKGGGRNKQAIANCWIGFISNLVKVCKLREIVQTVHTKHLPRTEFSNLRHYHGSKWPLTKSLTYWPKWSRNPHVVIFPILSSSDYTRRTNPRRNFRWSRSSAQRISHELRLSSTSLLDTFIWQCDRII